MDKCIILFISFILYPSIAISQDDVKCCKQQPRETLLQSYEANKIGFTSDSNDVGFMDFTVSLQYPIIFSLNNAIAAKNNIKCGDNDSGIFSMIKNETINCQNASGNDADTADLLTKFIRPVPYLAFTGRFGQYIETRKSSPVIGKRFNPKLILRFFTSGTAGEPLTDYLDLAYGHESNGQKIDSAASYQDMRDDFSREEENPEFARDYISRGWDYLELTLNKNRRDKYFENTEEYQLSLSLKYFLYHGLLQGDAEEYNWWENDDTDKHRKEFDGITVNIKRDINLFPTNDTYVPCRLSLLYTTGYKGAFSNNTIRGEILIKPLSIPVSFWISEGYNSDLVDYYLRVKSVGFCIFMETFH